MSILKYYELKSKLKTTKRSDVSPVYLFYGVEDYLKYDTLQRLEKILIEPDMHELNYSVFHIRGKGEKATDNTHEDNVVFEHAVSTANTLPFISANRMVVVKNIHKLAEQQDEFLGDYIKNPCKTTCLVLIGGDKLPKREIFRKTEKLFPSVNFYNLFDNQIPSWIVEYTKTSGKNISSIAADRILKITGNNLFDIKNEIDKLVLYVGCENEIELEDVEKCCGHFKENTVFELMHTLAEKKTEKVIKTLSNLFNNGEDEYMILAIITGRYRKYLKFVELVEGGVDNLEALIRCGVKSFQKDFLNDVARLEKAEIIDSLQNILEAEVKMKSGGNSKIHIERLLLELCLSSRCLAGHA